MKNIVIILDPAHGADVAGKRSPDGKHREYQWSRDRVHNIHAMLTALGYEVYRTTTSENEPGLSKRKLAATSFAKGKRKLLLSFHNDAFGNGSDWKFARGFSLWTTRGVTSSDKCSDIIFSQLKKDFPTIPSRAYGNSDLNRDFEENFTVLTGSDYMAVLIEWLFQDNKEDVKLLMDSSINRAFEKSIVSAIEKINGNLG